MMKFILSSGLNKAYGASQPNVSQSFLSQQPYLPQSQPTQYGQNTLPAMFAQNSAMEAQYDPRILSMTSMLPVSSISPLFTSSLHMQPNFRQKIRLIFEWNSQMRFRFVACMSI